MRLNFDKHFKIKMSDRNFTQRFDVFMTSLSSDNKITVQQCYICGERCDIFVCHEDIETLCKISIAHFYFEKP